ncbi:DUF3857 domain-containing protein [Croceicoccus sp. Ery15]|uniref:DUF3857 domain-containing protein n=1 Tax=Croceicoccus sp. Ery15 TaxID=1703338 RepID=UPI001E2F32D3|nr:DUF3857 domain-containing protein [Croceicoccus sp. Ery15]
MRFATALLLAPVMLAATPALAGEEVVYGPAPDWVDALATDLIDTDAKTAIARYDVQQRIEGGTVTVYIDRAIKLDSAEALTQAGTSTATWMPEKGDLTIHAVRILRGDEIVDVLAGGEKYTVLRREMQLESRTLDGMLTATMAVPGLRIGDVLNIVFSQTIHDETLAGGAQLNSFLFAKPAEAGFARNVVSWPADEAISWKAGPDLPQPQEETRKGYRYIRFDLPLDERDELPDDAPSRYTRPQIVQAGTFQSWEQVSAVFAPLYDMTGSIEPGSPLAKEVARIAGATDDPLERAAMATRLVQERIGYLMNGMSGGNYTPQAPARTWELRFGDCKAKSVLLLALLHDLGIDAEPVLVNTQYSDAAPEMVPMPAAFDHVIVRADIDGTPYWLDGTMTGTRIGNIANTPPYRFALPIRADGTGLQPVEPRVPAQADMTMTVVLDQRGGVDIPTLATVTTRLSGASASNLAAGVGQMSEEQRDKLLENFAGSSPLGALTLVDGDVETDDEAGTVSFTITGLMTTPWHTEGARKRHDFDMLPAAGYEFNADRARAAWRDIPVELGYPGLVEADVTILLPEQGEGFVLRGRPDLDIGYSGERVIRHVELAGDRLVAHERLESTGGEMPSAEIGRARTQAARASNAAPFLLSPADAPRAWQYAQPDLAKRLAPYEDAYAKAIERDDEDARSYTNRALFRQLTGRLALSLEDMDAAIAIDPGADNYRSRGFTRRNLGRGKDALADFRKAFEFDPTGYNARILAGQLARMGETEEALELLDDYDDYGDDHEAFVYVRSEVLAYADRADEGMAMLDALIEEQPGKGYHMNNACWYRARFHVGKDNMIEMCDKAVEQAGNPASVLDSRALAWLTMGDPAKAKADAEAALATAPDAYRTRYILGFAQRRLGEDGGDAIIDYVADTWPGIAEDYARYGLKP